MTESLAQYRRLERRLWMCRWKHAGAESAEEDGILDEMEQVWMTLGAEERASSLGEGPRCWPMESSVEAPRLDDGSYGTAWQYEGFHSATEAIISADAA